MLVDQNGAAAPKRGSHMVVGMRGVFKKHSVQKLLQQSAHARLLTWAKILHQRILEHAVFIGRLEVAKEKAERTFRHVLQHLFYLFGAVASANFLNDCFALEPV